MEQLEEMLTKIGDFKQEEVNLVLNNVTERLIPKGTILIREGQFSKQIFFILAGYLRTYQLVDGKDKSISFGQPRQFIVASNMFSDLPAEENIESITEAKVVSLDAEKLDYLKHRIPKISFLMNQLFQEVLDCKERRIKDFIHLSSTERYRNFVLHHPELLKVVSINHLSSYLGVAPETISRIRGKIIF